MNRDFENVIKCIDSNTQEITCCSADKEYLEGLKNNYFPNLKPCKKRPDAHSIVDNTILLIEHFEFDSSKPTSKGSIQHKISAQTDREIESILFNDDFAVVAECVEKNGKYYVDNFSKQFKHHLSRIDEYKIDIQIELSTKFSNFLVGFVIEDSTCFGSTYYDKGIKYVDLTLCKEFLDLFENTQGLDFVFFTSAKNDGTRFASFVFKDSISEHRLHQIEVSKISKFLYNDSFCLGGNITI